MPSAAASPSVREATAVRATITKLGPGLIAPTAIAPAMPSSERVLFMESDASLFLPRIAGTTCTNVTLIGRSGN
jgi:hypothetical protein